MPRYILLDRPIDIVLCDTDELAKDPVTPKDFSADTPADIASKLHEAWLDDHTGFAETHRDDASVNYDVFEADAAFSLRGDRDEEEVPAAVKAQCRYVTSLVRTTPKPEEGPAPTTVTFTIPAKGSASEVVGATASLFAFALRQHIASLAGHELSRTRHPETITQACALYLQVSSGGWYDLQRVLHQHGVPHLMPTEKHPRVAFK